MPQLLQHPEDFLLAHKRDIFVLKPLMSCSEEEYYDTPPDESLVVDVLGWLKSRGVATAKMASFADITLLSGWPGWYHVDFQGWDDPAQMEYSAVFEDANGKSLEPHSFQMMVISYERWLNEGGPEKYQEYLNTITDPDYCP